MAYFDKMREVDVFVVMAYCQYEACGYQNRFIADNNWFTMSIKREGHRQLIRDKKYERPHEDWARIKKSWPKLEVFDSCISPSLLLTNTHIIHYARTILGIKNELMFDYDTHLRSTDRLIDICKTYGADKYLSGTSGKKYLELQLFEENEIEVIFQDETKMDKRALVEVL